MMEYVYVMTEDYEDYTSVEHSYSYRNKIIGVFLSLEDGINHIDDGMYDNTVLNKYETLSMSNGREQDFEVWKKWDYKNSLYCSEDSTVRRLRKIKVGEIVRVK